MQVAQSPAQRTRAAKRAPAIPFPTLPDAQTARHDLFWRAAWLRTQAKRAALIEHADRVRSQRRTSEPLRYALIGAENALTLDATREFTNLVEAGGLLYAWLPEGGAA